MRSALALSTLLLLLPAPALASAVSSFSGVDGTSPAPICPGSFMLDLRLNAVVPGLTLSPTACLIAGLWEGLEIGLGGVYDLLGLGSGTPTGMANLVYPWALGRLPDGGGPFRLGYLVGGDLSLVPGTASAAGVSLLADHPIGSGLLGFIGGVKRTIGPSALHRLSLNLNYSQPLGPVSLYGELATNWPTSGPWDAALRGAIVYAASPSLSLDLNPGLVYTAGGFSFNPNVGLSQSF